MIFKGSGVALITPFNKNGDINFKKLKELINMHIEKHTDAIIVCGTTGESATLSDKEKKEIIKYSVKVAKGKIPIIAGTGSNDTKHTCAMTKFAKEMNADGALIVTPYYNKCNQRGLYEHYKKIANYVSDFPIILYNVPSRTGVNISIDTIIKLSKITNIVGIKEANPDISRIAELRTKVSDSFYIYSGNDDLTLPILSIGGNGVISVTANVIPNEIHNICESFFNKDITTSQKLFLDTLELSKKLFLDVNPIMIKECMNILGYNVGNTRLPLYSSSEENIKNLKITLKEMNLHQQKFSLNKKSKT